MNAIFRIKLFKLSKILIFSVFLHLIVGFHEFHKVRQLETLKDLRNNIKSCNVSGLSYKGSIGQSSLSFDTIENLNKIKKFDQDNISLTSSVDTTKMLLGDVNITDSWLEQDIQQILQCFEGLEYPESEIICRLAFIDGVRCPKWHEDHVTLRLVKTYCGIGTEWVNPDDIIVRIMNFIQFCFKRDLKVEPTNKINRMKENEILVMSGRKRAPMYIPILHRSPPTYSNSKRLLFTVTIT